MKENKLFRIIIATIICIAISVWGMSAIRFTPPLIKVFGLIGSVCSIWLYVKYIKMEYLNKKK